jgi:glycosyltransferase involved in cell wall biosynthesis
MKILSVNNTADIYGASRCMERVFGRFSQEGHEVHAVLPERGPLAEILEARGVQVHVHPHLSIIDRVQLRSVRGFLRFLIFFPLSVLWLVAITLRLRIDLIHTNTIVMPSPALAAFITRRPHFWHVRELLGEFGILWKPYQRYVHLLSSAVFAISRCTREQFDPDLQGKVHVIYDGLEESASEPDPARMREFRERFPSEAKLVGVVGRIKWHRKGQEVLVRAASLLRQRHPNSHYVLVGSPSPGNEQHELRLRELVSTLGLDDVITFVGDTNDPVSIFAALDIVVVPSIQPEPFGCVVIEAMAAGTPVVGSRCGGIAEQIVDEVSGLLFKPGDAEALAGALDRMLQNPSLRRRTAEEGSRRVRNSFRLETTCQSIAAFFENVAGDQIEVILHDMS